MLGRETVETVLSKFRGDITQVPPAHSAIKIGGRRAYELVREGKTVEIPERHITIHALDLVSYDAEKRRLLLDVTCSRGTYIRTLCIDIGRALGLPAVMTFLVRTRVGDFSLAEAMTLEELAEAGEAALLAPETMLSGLPRYDLPAGRENAFCNGLSTHDFHLAEDEAACRDGAIVRVYGAGTFLGIGRIDRASATVTPEKVIAAPLPKQKPQPTGA